MHRRSFRICEIFIRAVIINAVQRTHEARQVGRRVPRRRPNPRGVNRHRSVGKHILRRDVAAPGEELFTRLQLVVIRIGSVDRAAAADRLIERGSVSQRRRIRYRRVKHNRAVDVSTGGAEETKIAASVPRNRRPTDIGLSPSRPDIDTTIGVAARAIISDKRLSNRQLSAENADHASGAIQRIPGNLAVGQSKISGTLNYTALHIQAVSGKLAAGHGERAGTSNYIAAIGQVVSGKLAVDHGERAGIGDHSTVVPHKFVSGECAAAHRDIGISADAEQRTPIGDATTEDQVIERHFSLAADGKD